MLSHRGPMHNTYFAAVAYYTVVSMALFFDHRLIFPLFFSTTLGIMLAAAAFGYLGQRRRSDKHSEVSTALLKFMLYNLCYWLVVYCIAWSLGIEELPRNTIYILGM
jgi:uncharacterized membrane protein YccC